MKHLIKYLVPIFIFVLIGIPILVGAQIEEEPFIFEDCIDLESNYPRTADLCYILLDIRDMFYLFGLGLAIIVIIIGGIMYLTSGGDQSKTDKAKKTLTYGLIGVAIILLSAFLIGLLKEIIINRLG